MKIYPMVVDLSHWDPASDYGAVKDAGVVGVIFKATEGTSYTDSTYVAQRKAARAAGLLWGGYHFADGSDVNKQIDNFMSFCCPDSDELFCLDWEDNDGNVMSAANAKTWITEVERQLGRPGECVIYSGNTAKDLISGKDSFFGARRLWLCQYTSGTPTWQESWDVYWLWQFTDGSSGPSPHSIDGIGNCDINSYDQDGGAAQLTQEWASGTAGPGPTPPPGPGPTPPPVPRRTLQKGDKGEDVANLQAVLGLIDDGDFGEITETQVEAFQAACDNLDIDGVVGPATRSEVEALDARLTTGSEGLASDLAVQIVAAADNSSLSDYDWPDRGQSPPGYLAGMALSFAVAYQMLLDRDSAAVVMARPLEDDDTDALAWYESELTEIGVELQSPTGRLRALFVLMIGLGMRESSGRYCEGRDMSADNVASDTCEAGLFQTSWNISNASELFDDLIAEYWQDPTGYLGIFREGISPSANNLDVYGTGEGARYQFLAKFCPLFACLTSGLGLRLLRQHWGPINRHEVTVEGAAEDLLYEVQLLVEAGAGT